MQGAEPTNHFGFGRLKLERANFIIHLCDVVVFNVHKNAQIVVALPGVLYAFVLADRTADVEAHFKCLSLANLDLNKNRHAHERMLNRPVAIAACLTCTHLVDAGRNFDRELAFPVDHLDLIPRLVT